MKVSNAFITHRSGRSTSKSPGAEDEKNKSDAEALKVDDGTKSEGKEKE